MDTAQVKTMNTALAQLGQDPVSALDDAGLQGSAAAVKLIGHFDDARDTVLARHGWACALAYKTLSVANLPAGETNWAYPYACLLPPEALLVWLIEGQPVRPGLELTLGGVRWQVGSYEPDPSSARMLIRSTDAGPLNVAYVRRANWMALSPHLRDAIAFEIAARGAYHVTGDLAKQAKAEKNAEARILLAISSDGTQEGGQPAWAPSIPHAIRNLSR